ncbi:hypothetical protein BH09GEM1_BH09GEM1_39550 [soil metagenome]
MLSPSLFIVVRLIHVVVGIVWGGAIVFIAAFLLPAFRSVGPASGPVMGYLIEKKKMPMYMMAGVLLTVLSGLTLYWSDSMGSSAWMKSAPARTFGAGGVLAIIVAIMGMTINAPTAKKLSAIGEAVRISGGQPSPEQMAEVQRLQGRLAGAMKVAAVLVIATAALMAVARYMPA